MDEFSDPDFGDLFEELANFATFPLATSLSSTLGTTSFPRSFQHSFCPHRHSVNNNLRETLASTSSASRNLFDHFDASSAANTRVAASSFGSSSRLGHPANPSIATPRQPLASSQSHRRNELPLPAQSSTAAIARPTQITATQNRPPSPFTHFTDLDHDFFLNEFLGRDFSSPPPFLHRDPFSLPTTSVVGESSTAGATSSSSRTHENSLGIKREDNTQPTTSTNSGTGNEMPGRQNKETSGGATAATSGKEASGSSWTLPTLPQKRRQRSTSFGASSDAIADEGDMKVIDLVDTEVVPMDLKPEEPKKIVRLSSLNCTVCLDSMTNMTVTHCGHLFCGECLHIALSGKMFCPVCRNKIENKPKGGSGFTTRQKAYYVLKVKLGKKKSLGKRVVERRRVEKN